MDISNKAVADIMLHIPLICSIPLFDKVYEAAEKLGIEKQKSFSFLFRYAILGITHMAK